MKLASYAALTAILTLAGLVYFLAIQGVQAGQGPWPDPTLTPPAAGASR